MFSNFLHQFHNNIVGLRDFVDLIQPMLDEYHKKEIEKRDGAFASLAIAKQIHLEEDPELKDKLKNRLNEIFEGEIEVITEPLDEKDKKEEVNSKLNFRIKGDTSKMDEAIQFNVKSSEQRNLLYVNSLISLLSSAEWFYSRLLHFFYDQNPNAAGVKKKTLTLEELKTFGSVEDAEKYLIDSKIESLLRSSYSDWVDMLKSELKLGLGYLNDFNDELIEIYQRRNLLVHNGGIVNSIYISKVNARLLQNVEIGTKLSVDGEYLENAINKIHVLFSLIACELWKKQNPEDEDRGFYLMELSYIYLKRNEWEIAKLPNNFLKGDAKQPSTPKTYAILNCWLCEKRLDSNKKLMEELKMADFSDKALLIQLALMSLKDDSDSFFNLLPRVLDSEELSVESFMEFPIFREMRDSEMFENFIDEYEPLKKFIEQKTVPNISSSQITGKVEEV